MGPLILIILLAVSAGAVERSTKTPEHVLGGPINFQFHYDNRRGATAQVGYLLRFDGKDIKHLPRNTARLLRNPFSTTERIARELFYDADVGFFRMHFRLGRYLPLESMLSPLSAASDFVDRGYEAAEGGPPASPSRKRRPRIRRELTPVVDKIEQDLERGVQRSLIQAGFDLAVPSGRGASYADKEAVYNSLRKATQSWEESLRKDPEKSPPP